MRIVSFVPGATAAIEALGLRQQLVGVTHSCAGVADLSGVAARVLTRSRVPTVGSGGAIDGAVKTAVLNHNDVQVFDVQELEALRPELVILPAALPAGRSPCTLDPGALRRAAQALEPAPRLLEYGPTSLGEVLGMVRALGEALGKGAEAARLVAELKGRAEAVRDLAAQAMSRPRVALLCWLNPPYGAGGLLAELVRLAGGNPVLGAPSEAARALEWSHVVGVSPEVLLLAPCDFTLERARAEAEGLSQVEGLADTPAARWGQVHALAARRWFSAPSPLSVRALEILASLVHPELPWPEGQAPRDAWSPVALD